MRSLRAVPCIAAVALAIAAAPHAPAQQTSQESRGLFGRVLSAFNELAEPGPLTAAHASMDTDASCQRCHTLGEGVPDNACLACHTLVGDRISEHRGWHGQVQGECASCHSDHRGRDFDIMAFDHRAFNHEQATFRLVGAHRDLRCEQCHVDKVTGPPNIGWQFLGLPTSCEVCHATPHGEALAGGCQHCHVQQTWQDVHQFDHAAMTPFALTGAHRDLACSQCHSADDMTFAAIGLNQQRVAAPFACASCHENIHAPPSEPARTGQDSDLADCQRCHTTQDFEQPRFDHETMTDFPLDALHAGVGCNECHGPAVGDPPHTFSVRGADCAACHTVIENVLSGQRFAAALGAVEPDVHHGEITCLDCHPTSDAETRLSVIAERCTGCHTPAHGLQLFETARLVEESLQRLPRDPEGRIAEGPYAGLRGSDLMHNPVAWLRVRGGAISAEAMP
jgi:hypothetical protein